MNATTPCLARYVTRTDARCYVGTTLLVALGTPVACHASDTILARALPRSLVAGLPRGADWVAVTCCNRNHAILLLHLRENGHFVYKQQY